MGGRAEGNAVQVSIRVESIVLLQRGAFIGSAFLSEHILGFLYGCPKIFFFFLSEIETGFYF